MRPCCKATDLIKDNFMWRGFWNLFSLDLENQLYQLKILVHVHVCAKKEPGVQIQGLCFEDWSKDLLCTQLRTYIYWKTYWPFDPVNKRIQATMIRILFMWHRLNVVAWTHFSFLWVSTKNMSSGQVQWESPRFMDLHSVKLKSVVGP